MVEWMADLERRVRRREVSVRGVMDAEVGEEARRRSRESRARM